MSPVEWLYAIAISVVVAVLLFISGVRIERRRAARAMSSVITRVSEEVRYAEEFRAAEDRLRAADAAGGGQSE